jgi:DNA polymerase elongation subunit (family B)
LIFYYIKNTIARVLVFIIGMCDFKDMTTIKDALHGTIVTYKGENSLSNIIKYIKRSKILDPEKVKEIDKTIGNRRDILFLPNTVKEFHEINSSGKLSYRILIIGILTDGRKTAVILENIYPYFEVHKPENMSENEFRKKLNDIVTESYNIHSVTEVRAKGFDRYEKENSLYLRIYFYNIWERKKAIIDFQNRKWYTSTDDLSNYVRVLCRNEQFSLCAWNTISNIKSYRSESICKLDKTFRVGLKNICEYKGEVLENESMVYERTVVKTWDIEAYSSNKGMMPDPDNKEDVVFAIGQTYHWKNQNDSILDVCLISRPCAARSDKLTIYCTSESDLIKASFTLDKYLQPEFIVGFNDGDFDWPFIIKKAERHDLIIFIHDQLTLFHDKYNISKMNKQDRIRSILTWDCQKKTIKLDAEYNAFSKTMSLPGYINIDVRTIFRKLHNTEIKSSLKFYLSLHNLGGKEDMPIHILFQIYEESIELEKKIEQNIKNDCFEDIKNLTEKFNKNKERMADVAHYCTIDAKRCQELILKVNVISDKREVSNVSHTSLYDAIYYADGMKVRNLIICEAQKRGLLLSVKSKPYLGDSKYPGGHVYPPIQGPVKPKLSIRERVKINLPGWCDLPEEDIVEMENTIYDNFKKDTIIKEYDDLCEGTNLKSNAKELFLSFLKEKNKYPISGLDFSSLYPSIIMAYNLSPEYMLFTEEDRVKAENDGHTLHSIEFLFDGKLIKAWSIRHDTSDGINIQTGKTTNKFGLYPYILKNLFDKRVHMKKGLKQYAKTKEIMEKENKHGTKEFAQICFNYNYIDAKQKALKVFMNTFYGETGNKLSPFVVLAIAGGITTIGQRSIKMIVSLMRQNDYTLYYGDTDSCYISCPDRCFTYLDRQYYGNRMEKLEYCTQLVKETFTQIENGKRIANACLIKDNGTIFLNMAYEEVLYPAIFLLKKMYTGIEHQSIVNFFPHSSAVFTKGLASHKRGTAEVLKTVCMELLVNILSIYSLKDIITMVETKIREVYTRTWELSIFKKDAVYKPHKKNIPVHTFYNRMKERNDIRCPLPVPGERFSYVIVKKYPYTYDIQGRKTKLGMGDRWEYFEYAKDNNLTIDLHCYMTGGIIGQFAQFLAFYPRFQKIPDNDSCEAANIAVKKTLNNAKIYITDICKTEAQLPVCQGPILKKLYSIANKSCNRSITKIYEREISVFEKISTGNIYDAMYKSIITSATKRSNIYAIEYIKHMRKKYSRGIVYIILKTFHGKQNSVYKARILNMYIVENNIRTELSNYSKQLDSLFDKKNNTIQDMIAGMKKGLDIEDIALNKILPDLLDISKNNIVDNIINGKSEMCSNYELFLEQYRTCSEKINNLYTSLNIAISHKLNASAILERAQYYIDKQYQENPLPPGISEFEEQEKAIEYIKTNIIDF